MLLMNQCLDKLTALHTLLVEHGLMPPLKAPPPLDPFDAEHDDKGADDGEHLLAKVHLAKKQGMLLAPH